MKKFVSVVLALILCISVFPLCAWAKENTEYPIIRLNGDGTTIYNKDGKEISEIFERAFGGEDDDADTVGSVINVLKPFFLEGLLQNKWDNYYAAFEKEVSELVGDFKLDTNGNPVEGSGISQQAKDSNTLSSQTDYKLTEGSYKINQYVFNYDWRLDPYEIADQLHEYVLNVKKTTGAKEVCLYARCLGGVFALAYLDKYAETDGIHGVSFNGTVGFGNPSITEGFCGELVIDDDAIERKFIDKGQFDGYDLSDFIYESIDLAVRSHAVDVLDKTVYRALYNKLYVNLTNILSTATFATLPSHWAMVDPERYEEAKKMVFGDENSEKYQEYAGLIAKLDYYHEHCASRIQEILNKVNEKSNVCILAQYGCQCRPYTTSADQIADSEVTLRNASGFATVAKDVFSQLDEDYIKAQTDKGLGKYISPDKQIDASTCYFPDYTWIVKGLDHASQGEAESNLMMEVMTSETQLTCDDCPCGFSRFMIRTSDDRLTEMTAENCYDSYYATGNIQGEETTTEKTVNYFKTLINWIKLAFEALKKFISSKLNLG